MISGNEKDLSLPAEVGVFHSFPIIAIGASAGGLDALERFFSHVPLGCGLAFVVIQHLDPAHKGMLVELLQRVTLLPVTEAKNQMKVRSDCIYVIPPNADLSILHNHLYLLAPTSPHGLRLPIDFFFYALAEAYREQAVGVILSGMGSDGTLGLSAIKACGGLILVQEPGTAKFDSMPKSAIAAGLANIVAPPEALPQCIIDALHHTRPVQADAPHLEHETPEQKSAFDKVYALLRTHTGHDFSCYKKTTVYRRIERRMNILQLKRVMEYVYYLRENPQEVDLLFKELLIGVTSFFRDPAAWEYLKAIVLPKLIRAYPPNTVLRAWVAGCSTGEEAYSLGIVFQEVLAQLQVSDCYFLKIFATDIDAEAIKKARRGFYPSSIASGVSQMRLKRFFVDDGDGYRISKNIREMVVFALQDLILDPPFTRLDILSCRNLLIYLGPELQKRVFPLFHYSLKSGGVLLLGSAESVGSFTELFAPLDSKSRLFQRSGQLLRAKLLEFPTRDVIINTELIMDAKTEPVTSNLQNLANELLLQQFSPTAVLVTAAGDLVYISGRTGKYLEPAAGKVNWNIHAMARDGLRQEIALSLPKALRTGETVFCRSLAINMEAGTQLVDLTIQPVATPAELRGMVMLVFADVASPPPEAATRKRSSKRSQREAELEQLLLQMQEEVQTLREEMQSSQEELKSANEELQSTNEELQSMNEELTTSKEEMQSLNEELQTVNAELQTKVDELSIANNDMNNLLNSTDMATIFLDNALHVRRFTTQATRLFKLIPGDIGRALSDIVSQLDYPGLFCDAEEVLRTLVFSDREVATNDNCWFQVKIMPYRTLENIIDGIVITFNGISRAKQLEAELRIVGRDSGEHP